MKKNTAIVSVHGLMGMCGAREVFVGFAPARILHKLSFADVLNDETGEGYQRPRNREHSLDFKKYIKSEGSSTIPLTFNLRKELQHYWHLQKGRNGITTLYIDENSRCLAQVDCQHRLGELQNEDISLAFMCFIGLDLRTEMAQFVIINSKAKGLSSSLTDYHTSNLLTDLAAEAPHLFIAKKLNEDPESPWFRLIRYGGETTSGLRRRTSFRMMQKAIHRLLSHTQGLKLGPDRMYTVINDYWKAIEMIFPIEWSDHRHHLITKGVGLHSLTRLLADIIVKGNCQNNYSVNSFKEQLTPLKGKIDWSSRGKFAHAGGQKGVQQVHEFLKEVMKFESTTGRARL